MLCFGAIYFLTGACADKREGSSVVYVSLYLINRCSSEDAAVAPGGGFVVEEGSKALDAAAEDSMDVF